MRPQRRIDPSLHAAHWLPYKAFRASLERIGQALEDADYQAWREVQQLCDRVSDSVFII